MDEGVVAVARTDEADAERGAVDLEQRRRQRRGAEDARHAGEPEGLQSAPRRRTRRRRSPAAPPRRPRAAGAPRPAALARTADDVPRARSGRCPPRPRRCRRRPRTARRPLRRRRRDARSASRRRPATPRRPARSGTPPGPPRRRRGRPPSRPAGRRPSRRTRRGPVRRARSSRPGATTNRSGTGTAGAPTAETREQAASSGAVPRQPADRVEARGERQEALPRRGARGSSAAPRAPGRTRAPGSSRPCRSRGRCPPARARPRRRGRSTSRRAAPRARGRSAGSRSGGSRRRSSTRTRRCARSRSPPRPRRAAPARPAPCAAATTAPSRYGGHPGADAVAGDREQVLHRDATADERPGVRAARRAACRPRARSAGRSPGPGSRRAATSTCQPAGPRRHTCVCWPRPAGERREHGDDRGRVRVEHPDVDGRDPPLRRPAAPATERSDRVVPHEQAGRVAAERPRPVGEQRVEHRHVVRHQRALVPPERVEQPGGHLAVGGDRGDLSHRSPRRGSSRARP